MATIETGLATPLRGAEDAAVAAADGLVEKAVTDLGALGSSLETWSDHVARLRRELAALRRGMGAPDRAGKGGEADSLSRFRDEALEAERRARFEETAALTRMVESLSLRLAVVEADLAERDRQRQELLDWKKAVLSSTSWRITGPLRAVKDVVGKAGRSR